jgi:hypothetical protein
MNLQNAFVPAMMMCLAVLTAGCSRDPIVEGSDAGTCVEGTACQGSANPTAGSANPTTGPADPTTASEPTTGGGTSGAGASCGDGTCDAGEGCEGCPGDCGACLPDAPELFSIAILPDTQTYTGDDERKIIFDAQTSWIADNRAVHNIVAVVHEGDIVGDADCPDQWLRAQAAMAKIGPEIPTVIALGNHDGIDYVNEGCDKETETKPIGSEKYDQYFPYAGNGETHDGSGVNSYITVRAVDGDNPVDLLILTLEFGPSDEQLKWANDVAEAHPDHIGIVVTHDYLGDDGELRGARDCVESKDNQPVPLGCLPEHGLPDGFGGTPMEWANQGFEMYEEFIALQPNIRFVFSGHVVKREVRVNGVTVQYPPDDCQKDCDKMFTAGQKISVRDGAKVFQLEANYQIRTDFQDGYLRLLTINAASDWFGVQTISPYNPEGPPTYLTDAENYFSIFDAQIREHGTTPQPPAFGSFADVAPDHPYLTDIERANYFGLMRGDVEARLFHPDQPLDRQAAAQVVWRALNADDPAAVVDSTCTNEGVASTFPDVAPDSPFCWAIAQMAATGRIAEAPGSDFHPAAPITRAQLMAFMFQPGNGEAQDCLAPPFPDVAVNHPSCRSIELAAAAGVASGDLQGNFGPDGQVEREAAAAAIIRFEAP